METQTIRSLVRMQIPRAIRKEGTFQNQKKQLLPTPHQARSPMDMIINQEEGEDVHAFNVYCKKCGGDIYLMLLVGENSYEYARLMFRVLIDHIECVVCEKKGKLLLKELSI